MLEPLDSRPCKLGVYLNTPTQKNGDERVPAKVLGIKNILLTKDELNELLDDKHAWDALYVERKGKPAMPIFADKLGPLIVLGKFKGSTVNLSFGLRPYEIAFTEATCKSLKLERTEGGLTALSFTVVCLKSNVGGELARLDEHLDGNADIVLRLGDPEDDDADDEDEDAKQEGLDLDHTRSASASKRETDKQREERIGQHQADALAKSTPVNGKQRRGRAPKITPTGDSVN
jgi:hypothetical protein